MRQTYLSRSLLETIFFCHEKKSATGTRTRVVRVRAEYPNQLDYSRVGVLAKSVCCWWKNVCHDVTSPAGDRTQDFEFTRPTLHR